MKSGLRYMRWAIVLALLVAGFGVLAGNSEAAPTQQTLVCNWEMLPGSASQPHFHVAGAMDTTNHQWYFYGGKDKSDDIVNFVGKVDLSNADINQASHGNVAVTGALERYGAIGAYRPKGDDSAVYWIGGGDNDGTGQDDVQVFNIKNNTWGAVTPNGALPARLFHAGAYDPDHDAIVVHGGTNQCRADGKDLDDQAPEYDPGACKGANLGTSFLTFDPTSGALSWQGGPSGGPGQVYGHSMVYDSAGKRMLVFGGTTDGSRAKADVYQLDLSDPNLGNASWSKLTTGGRTPSARFFHSAAYDKANNRMVVYGGVTREAFTTSENTASDTFVLDLGQTPPSWSDLGTSVQDRVGGVMAYDENHGTPVLHAGRRRFRFGGQTVSGDSHYIKCEAPPPTLPPPPTVPGGAAFACDFVQGRVPAAVINAALANPSSIQGYNQLQNPGVPEGPWNLRRTALSLRSISAPWHPLYNGLIYKAGCP